MFIDAQVAVRPTKCGLVLQDNLSSVQKLAECSYFNLASNKKKKKKKKKTAFAE